MKDYLLAIAFVALTVLCWGAYGPVLHKGQTAMQNSRLRPFLFVGVAYFVIAVIVPVVMLQAGAESDATFTTRGVLWSSMAGVAGAVGALGIIMAFNFGGKPSYVMPLVFGCAPVVNALLTIYWAGTYRQIRPMFLAGLILVALGAAMVLAFAPSPKRHGPAATAVAATPAVESPPPQDVGNDSSAEPGAVSS